MTFLETNGLGNGTSRQPSDTQTHTEDIYIY